MNVLCMIVRFQADSKESHVIVVKRIFRYMKGIIEFGIWYPKNNDFSLSAFIDVDWVGDVDDRKSTSGGTFFLGKKLISWMSKNKNAISLSIVEVKYTISANNYTQRLWMK
jgi:hypothetical protein